MEEDGDIRHARGCGNSTECTSAQKSQNCQTAGTGADAIKVCPVNYKYECNFYLLIKLKNYSAYQVLFVKFYFKSNLL